MIDLHDCTFLIPFYNSNKDREYNINHIFKFLNDHFETNVIVAEQGKNFIEIKQYDNLHINHIKYYNSENIVLKNKLYNIGFSFLKTNIVIQYDSDVLVPPDQLLTSVEYVRGEYDYSFPYDSSCIQIYKELKKQKDNLLSAYNFKEYSKHIMDHVRHLVHPRVPPGGCILMKRKTYTEMGMENENFVGYGPEDKERKLRLEKLEFKNKNANGYIFHIEHDVPPFYRNIVTVQNEKELDKIKRMNKEQIVEHFIAMKYKEKYGIDDKQPC